MSAPHHPVDTDGASPSCRARLVVRSAGALAGALGLTGVLERALRAGGTLGVDAGPGRGTGLRARRPLESA